MVVVEPKSGLENLTAIRLKLGMDYCLANQGGSVWVFYRSLFNCQIIVESAQYLIVQVQSQLFLESSLLSCIHAKCTAQERMVLWGDLLRDRPLSAL